ncbi:hypothetical protein [Mesorhizobium sp. KR1-2]|uniref:hypothetical protein n=1 Tax=Mesorhizobium sp. KR1-2 TaxID=3156609 RepID=UPI0032B4C95E
MDDGQQLKLTFEAQFERYLRNFERAQQQTDRRFRSIEQRAKQAGERMEANMARSATRINHHLAGIGTKIGSFGKAFAGGLVGGMFVGGLEGFARGVKSTVSELATLHKTIERIGMDAKVFQELQFGFQLAGVETGAFADGMDKFNKNIAVAATQGGKLADILKANGVAIRDQNGNIRSSESLLRDYAELVKNAGSEQERLLLVTEAFGRGDANFVNALKNGKEGLDDMAQAAEDAGGTIDKDLLKKADDFDDQWDRAWHRFDVNAKSAILTAITWLDRLYEKSQEIGNSGLFRGITEGMAGLGLLDSDLTIHDPDLARAAGREFGPDARIRDAFKTGAETALNEADAALIAELQKRYGGVAKKAETTIIPGKPEKPERPGRGSRNAAAEMALREAEAVQRLIENLSEELRLVGASDLEKAKSNALRRAGAAATAEQRAQIEQLVTAIHTQTMAHEQAAEAADFFRQTAAGAFMDLIPAIETGNKALDNLLNTLIQAVAQAALLGQGPLAGLFGGGGGLLGSLFGFASGGFTGAGGKYEPAGVVHKGEFVMSKEATSRIGVANLEALHRGALRGFAAGGYVGNSPAIRRTHMPANSNAPAVQAISINAPITINGSAGTPEQNADLAAKMAKQMEQTMRGAVADEIRRQSRPGNFLNSRSR